MRQIGRSRLGVALLVVVVGCALGIAGRVSQQGPDEVAWILDLGVPWLAVSFGLGAIVGGRGRAFFAGAAMLVVSVIAYYVYFHSVEHQISVISGAYVAALWSAAGIVSGGVFAYAGSHWRTSRDIWPVALLAGSLVAEAVLLLTLGQIAFQGGIVGPRIDGAHYQAGQTTMLAELAAGLTLPVLMIRDIQARTVDAVVACGLAVTSGVALQMGLRVVMWGLGWRGL